MSRYAAAGELITRRSFVILLLLVFACQAYTAEEATNHPAVSKLADEQIAKLLAFREKWDLPGCAIAVGARGKVLAIEVSGHADVDQATPVEKETVFRWASLSKPLTAAAVVGLVQDKKLELNTPVFKILAGAQPPHGKTRDPLYETLTVEDCLRHTTGWDRATRFDPMLRRSVQHAKKLYAEKQSITALEVLGTRLLSPPDFAPGSDYAYSNLGYITLGLIVEKVSRTSYPEAVFQGPLAGMKLDSLHPANSLELERAENEATYYDDRNQEHVPSVVGDPADVAWPYGAFSLELLLPAAGWSSSVTDALQCFMAIAPFREDASELAIPPITPSVASKYAQDEWYGLGWRVRQAGGSQIAFHIGSMPGTTTGVVARPDGEVVVILSNGRPEDWVECNKELEVILTNSPSPS